MEVEQGGQVRRKTMVRRPGEGEKKEQDHMSSAGALEASSLPRLWGLDPLTTTVLTQDVGCHQLLTKGDVQDLGQLAAEFLLEREQQEGHRDYARQQEEEEGAGGQL